MKRKFKMQKNDCQRRNFSIENNLVLFFVDVIFWMHFIRISHKLCIKLTAFTEFICDVDCASERVSKKEKRKRSTAIIYLHLQKNKAKRLCGLCIIKWNEKVRVENQQIEANGGKNSLGRQWQRREQKRAAEDEEANNDDDCVHCKFSIVIKQPPSSSKREKAMKRKIAERSHTKAPTKSDECENMLHAYTRATHNEPTKSVSTLFD